MIKIAKENIFEREILFREASLKSNISDVIIEKDFWVCFILDHLFNYSRYKDNIFFKGGTSLSKCYGVIERFSEDVDLIIDSTLIGISATTMSEKRSNNQENKFKEEINLKTKEFLINDFIPNINDELKKRELDHFELSVDINDPLSILFIYENIHDDIYIKPQVKLEIGALAAKVPIEIKKVEPYVKTYNPEIGDISFPVKTIKKIRTFFEKLTILHDMAHKNKDYNLRYSRHYYDTYMLIISGILEEAFLKLDLFTDVVEFKNKFYYSKRSNVDDILLGNLKLIPSEDAISMLKNDYIEMRKMFFGFTPKFDDILKELKIIEININKKLRINDKT